AAAEAGAELREGFTVEEVVIEDWCVVGIRGHSRSGSVVEERASIVIGADGRHSVVAKALQPHQYHEKPALFSPYYSYWSGLPMNGRFETYIRSNRGCAAVETHDGLTIVMVGWPYSEFETNKKDVEANYMSTLDLAPAFAERLRGAKREAPFVGAAV